jgi:hypothetical protein
MIMYRARVLGLLHRHPAGATVLAFLKGAAIRDVHRFKVGLSNAIATWREAA